MVLSTFLRTPIQTKESHYIVYVNSFVKETHGKILRLLGSHEMNLNLISTCVT